MKNPHRYGGESSYDAWAEYYDLIHRGLPGETEFYVGQAVKRGGPTLELGCGTGRLALPMAMSGVDVTGLDNSKPMLARCRAKKRRLGRLTGRLTLVHGDMRDFHLDRRFDLVVMAYRTIMHLHTPAEQVSCLKSACAHLNPEGLLILNTWVPRPSALAPLLSSQGGWLQFAGRYLLGDANTELIHFCSTTCDEHHQLLFEEHVLHEVDARGNVLRTEVLPMERAWLTPREMGHLAGLCGLEVEAVFGDFDCSPFTSASTEMIWVLRNA